MFHVSHIPTEGSPWNFVTVVGLPAYKENGVPTRMSNSVTICPFVLTQYRHGQTDTQTERIGKRILHSACMKKTELKQLSWANSVSGFQPVLFDRISNEMC